MSRKPVAPTALDVTIDSLHRELAGYDSHSDEYAQTVDQLIKLYAIKKEETPDRISKDTLALVLGNLAGIFVIVGHERAHIVTSKALSFVGKFH